MDPLENLNEQRLLATRILACVDGDQPIDANDVARLAELVVALDEWRLAGGFDPYTP